MVLFTTRHEVSFLHAQQLRKLLQHMYLVLIPKTNFLYVKCSLAAHKFGIRYEDD